MEENARKALMRGVCALNMEAISIFNDTNKTLHQNESDQPIVNNPFNFDFNEHLRQMSQEIPKNKTNSSLSEIETQELSRRVKNYCETSLNKNQTTLNKAKQSLLNSNNHETLLTINPNVVSHAKLLNSCNRVFNELTEHNIQNKPITTHKQTKSRLSTKSSESLNPISSSSATLQIKNNTSSKLNLPPQLPAYRSFIIEKHTNNNTHSNTTATRVKYAPPGQPATVLNTVINSIAQ